MSKIPFDLPGEHDDHQINEFMHKARQFGNDLQGDLIGPFDHPDNVPGDEPFVVEHELEEIPDGFAVEDPGYTGRGVYSTEADREQWTAETITLRSPDPNNKHIVVRVRRSFDG